MVKRTFVSIPEIDRNNAIRNIYPNVTTISTKDSIEETFDENGNLVSIDEVLIQSELTRMKTEYDDKIIKQSEDKDNANTKLKDLGLTDDEIKAIKGIS